MSKTTIKRIVISLLAVVLMFGAVKGSLAYFTDYEENSGTATVILKGEGKIVEEIDDDNKHITIENTGETPIIARVRIFANAEITKTVAVDPEWKQSGDWWYYNTSIKGGESTSELLVSISFPENAKDGDTFNVVVVYECTPVLGDTGPVNADWSVPVKEKTGGGN